MHHSFKQLLVRILWCMAAGHALLPPAALARDAIPACARQHGVTAIVVTGPAQPCLLEVSLDELHPTQGAIGYDQVYYKLGRYAAEARTASDVSELKKFADLCEANGQGDPMPGRAGAGATLSNPPSGFRCEHAPGSSHPEKMKTVVIGPQGKLYLTDGHHTFSTFWEADGGRNHRLKVQVKVTDNFSHLDERAFWTRMQQENKVWLRDGRNQPLTPQQLPAGLGLHALGDDPYRSLAYFTRDIGYELPDSAPEFLEFYWAQWLREQPSTDLARFRLDQPDSYASAILAAAQAMVALAPSAIVSGGKSAASLGVRTRVDRKKLDELAKGKLRHALAYRKALGE